MILKIGYTFCAARLLSMFFHTHIHIRHRAKGTCWRVWACSRSSIYFHPRFFVIAIFLPPSSILVGIGIGFKGPDTPGRIPSARPFFVLFFCLSFVSLFWPPGRPKRSIVATLAPKMTPKWSPKWSQGDNGRPLRNMHRRCRIAYSTPWEGPFSVQNLALDKDPQKSI